MNTTRIGKIGRLPHALRETVNRRLQEGEPGSKLIAWLNSLPEVQAILAADFDGQPINAPNFTAWRKGGYRDWLAQQEARALAQQLGQASLAGDPEGGPPPTDALAWWVAAHYAVVGGDMTAAEGTERWRLLRIMCADVSALRRGDHSAKRLELVREWQTIARLKGQVDPRIAAYRKYRSRKRRGPRKPASSRPPAASPASEAIKAI